MRISFEFVCTIDFHIGIESTPQVNDYDCDIL